MKHKKKYNLVRKLIDKRELDEDNMETAHEELIEIVEEDETCGWAYGLLAEIYYWMGETADDEDKLFYYDKGVEYGEQGVAADEDSLEANFWLAVNYGSFGQEKGIMKSLSLITPIRERAEKVLELDEGYFYGGAWRVLGRLYHKAPGFPLSVGNSKKALECFEKALEFGAKFYLNHLFIAEFYISERKKDKARKHLEWILEAELNQHHEIEDEVYKRDAERLLKKL